MGTLTPSGISLIGIAKQELNMPSTLVIEAAGKQAWIDATNKPGPVKTCKMLMDPDLNKEVDWMWIELSTVPQAEIITYRTLISSAKKNGCKAIIFYWCGESETMNKKAEEWANWCSSVFLDWEPTKHQLQNVHCGGPIRYTTSLLLLLPAIGIVQVWFHGIRLIDFIQWTQNLTDSCR